MHKTKKEGLGRRAAIFGTLVTIGLSAAVISEHGDDLGLDIHDYTGESSTQGLEYLGELNYD